MGTARLRKLQLLLLLGAWRALGGAAKCRVTLILSPQKATGADCRSSEPTQDSELATLRMRLGRHEELLRALQRRAVEGGELAGEVRALREQSLTLNTHLGQLRAQLQQEARAEPDLGAEPAAALGLLAERALDAQAEARRTAARLQQLDAQLREHAQLMSQHSSLLSRLQRACAGPDRGQQQVAEPRYRCQGHHPLLIGVNIGESLISCTKIFTAPRLTRTIIIHKDFLFCFVFFTRQGFSL